MVVLTEYFAAENKFALEKHLEKILLIELVCRSQILGNPWVSFEL